MWVKSCDFLQCKSIGQQSRKIISLLSKIKLYFSIDEKNKLIEWTDLYVILKNVENCYRFKEILKIEGLLI